MELEELAVTIRRMMYAFDVKRSEHIDDAIQEGVLTGWKALEAGSVESDAHLVNKAMQKAKAYLYDAPRGRRHATGHPGGNTFTAVQKGVPEKVEKIHQFVREYKELHGEPPLATWVAKGVGVSLKTAQKYMYASAPTLESSRACDEKPPNIPLSAWENSQGSLEGHAELGTTFSAEDDALGEMNYRQFFKLTKPRRAQLIYLYHVEGYTQNELASMYGIAQMTVSRDIANGLKDIREALRAM